jgi:hypothetical protein
MKIYKLDNLTDDQLYRLCETYSIYYYAPPVLFEALEKGVHVIRNRFTSYYIDKKYDCICFTGLKYDSESEYKAACEKSK